MNLESDFSDSRCDICGMPRGSCECSGWIDYNDTGADQDELVEMIKGKICVNELEAM